MGVRLVHYMAQDGTKHPSEYLALLAEDETVFEHRREGYTVYGVFELVGLSNNDSTDSLPLGSAFVEG